MALFSDDLFNVFEEQPETEGAKGKKRRREDKEKGGGVTEEPKRQRLVEASEQASSPADGEREKGDDGDEGTEKLENEEQ